MSDTFFTVYCCVLAAVIGAVLGSFLNCTAWRIAHGESFVKGRSRCPACGHPLGVLDLVPIFSWLFLRGKCRYCGTKISARYPLSELAFAAVTVLCLLRFGLTAECPRNLIFFGCLFCLSLVDLESCIIPDGCLAVAALAWAAWLPFSGLAPTEIGLRVLAALVYGGGLLLISLAADKILGKESLGGGDIKLFAVMGLYLGMTASLFALLLSCVLGLVFAFARRTFSRRQDEHFPFGPAIAAASWFMMMYGQPLVDWYLRLLGLG